MYELIKDDADFIAYKSLILNYVLLNKNKRTAILKKNKVNYFYINIVLDFILK